MTVLNSVKSATKDVADLTTGLGSVALAPVSDSKTVTGETKTYVKKAYGTLLDGFLIVPSVGIGYLLLNPPSEGDDNLAFRLGKATGAGVAGFVLIWILRNLVGWF